MGVLIRRNLQRDTLMQSVGADPIQVGAGDLEYRDTGIGCAADGFGEPVVGVSTQRYVESGRGHTRTQAFDDWVSPENHLGIVGLLRGRTRLRFGRSTFGSGMMGSHVGGRCGAATFETAPTL